MKIVYLEMRFFVIESNHYPFLDGHLLADEDIIMVSPKDPAMSSFRLTSSFCLTSGKAEEIPVNPVDPVKARHGFSAFTPSLDGSLSQLQRRPIERADEVQAPPLWFTAPFLK